MSYRYDSVSSIERSHEDHSLSKNHDVVDTSYSRTSENKSDDLDATSSSKSQALYSLWSLLKNIGINLVSILVSIVILIYAMISWRANDNPIGNREHLLLEIAKYVS